MAEEHDQPGDQTDEPAAPALAAADSGAYSGADSGPAAVAAEPPLTTKAPAPTPIWTPPPALRRNGKPKRKRISRWDRPPEPHDWRWAVGHIGRALITLGLLMFGFVAYQLWGTGIQTARAQNQLDTEFDNLFEENGIVPDILGPPTSTTVVATPGVTPVTTPGTTSATDLPAASDPTAPTDTVAADTTVPPTTAAPVEQNYGNIDPGDALLKLVIPRIDFNWKVVAGVSSKDLAKGPGHFADTPLPGQLGNSAIAGHRTGHGGPFLDLDRLQPGDEIQVYTKLGGAYAYIVTDSVVVGPSDYQVITDSDPNIATLTLVTCDPKYTSKRRLVVHATIDPTRGSPVGLPLIYYGQDEPIPVEPILPSDDTTLDTSVNTSPATTVATGSTDTTTGSSTGSSSDGAAPIETDLPTSSSTAAGASDTSIQAPNVGEFEGEDAFSQGWFDDGAAWPHVIGWVVLLAAVAYGAFRLAKRYRRLYLAFLVGFVPFVLVLYFFYENVNRLLPAAI